MKKKESEYITYSDTYGHGLGVLATGKSAGSWGQNQFCYWCGLHLCTAISQVGNQKSEIFDDLIVMCIGPETSGGAPYQITHHCSSKRKLLGQAVTSS